MAPSQRKCQGPDVAVKSGWRVHRFDEMAIIVSDRVDDPSEAGVDRYVGLDHLDSDSLTIRRWGSPDDVEATKLRFRAGDIIFGRRRAYQRKLAVAHFEGICSAHAMVLRARPGVVLPELLPFFMQGEVFMERAKEISVGSLSPTINWKTLAVEEFALPPLEEQARFVLVLNAARRLVEAAALACDRLETVRNSLLGRELGSVARTRLGDITSTITKGTTPTTVGRSYVPSGIPFLRAEDIVGSQVDLSACSLFIDAETHDELRRSQIQPRDVLLTIAGTIGRVGIAPETVQANCNQAVAIIRMADAGLAAFTATWLQTADAQRQIQGGRVTGTISNLSLGQIQELNVPSPSRAVADNYVAAFKALSVSLDKIVLQKAAALRVMKGLLEKLDGMGV
jgi:hypothetical protein